MKFLRFLMIGIALLFGRGAVAEVDNSEVDTEEWFAQLTLEEQIEYCHGVQEDDYLIQEAFHPDDWEFVNVIKKECDSLVVPTTNPTVGDSSGGGSVWL